MKVVIDLIEDTNDKKNLIYAGEASVASFHIDELSKELNKLYSLWRN